MLDTSALIMGLDPLGLQSDSYSVPEVAEELRQQTGPSYRMNISTSSGKMRIQTPTEQSLGQVTEAASKLGDKVVLSKTDMSVLALALDLAKIGKAPVIISDDYAVQNVAEALKMNYQSLATFGIREKFNWIFYCPACFRKYASGEVQDCAVCGTRLKRKPMERETAKQRAN